MKKLEIGDQSGGSIKSIHSGFCWDPKQPNAYSKLGMAPQVNTTNEAKQ